MTVAALVLAGVIALCAAGYGWRTTRSGLLHDRRRKRVLVTLKSGEAFQGVLYEADSECLVLRDAVAMAYGPRQENVIVEGEALILRPDVAYIQLP